MQKINAMDKELKSFEDIRQITDAGKKYWLARDFQKPLGYDKWENFSKVIDRAMLACDTSGFDISEHFPIVKKTVEMPIGEQFGSRGFPDIRKTKKIIDYQLSRYACYLIVQNGDYLTRHCGLDPQSPDERRIVA
ncbi:hypothetical protein FACS1894156_1820 [Bacteroidia bacterium]|nr:hypothetical protein FACS1894156_1820 [Bacteroidia bacterium]